MWARLELVEAVTIGAQHIIAATPVLLYLDEDLKEDTLVEEALHVLARHHADLLERCALVPDDNALLAVTLYDDQRLDVDALVLLLEGLDDDLYRVGDLLLVVEQHLLADDLSDEEAGGLVRQGILVEVRG